MRRMFGLAALAAGIALTGSAGAQEKVNLSIVTGGTGGVYYPMGGGLANLLSKNIPGYQATAEVTGGSVDNLKLVGSNKAEVAFVMADASLDALKGEDKFKGQPLSVRALAVLYPNQMHVVTVDGTGIAKMADLKGKRVSTGSPGSATEVMAFRVIEASGLDKDKDLKRERLGVAESVNALKDRKIDAFFWVGGVPTSAVTDLGATPGLKIKLIDHAEAVDAMNKKYGQLYSANVVPKDAYPGQDAENKNVVVWNLLIANEKLSDQVAYNVVKTLFEHKPEMVATHKESENIKMENQDNTKSPLPYHKGAIKYFAEKGIALK